MNCIFSVIKPSSLSSSQITVRLRTLLQRHSINQPGPLHLNDSFYQSIENRSRSDRKINQSINQLDDQSSNQSTSQMTNQITNLSINQSVNQSTNQSVNQPINQSINRSFKPVKAPWISVGHGGTLDLDASGVLVIGVGRGCSQLEKYLKNCSKTYTVTGQLGCATDTFDSTGQVIPDQIADYSAVTRSQLEAILSRFTGMIMQRPPVYSALTINGMRGYHYARSQTSLNWAELEAVRPPAREAHIKSCMLESFNRSTGRFSLRFETGSGVYIRTLIDDIGRELGVYAHVTQLCRVSQGEFVLDQNDTDDRECVALELEQVTVQEVERRANTWNNRNPTIQKTNKHRANQHTHKHGHRKSTKTTK